MSGGVMGAVAAGAYLENLRNQQRRSRAEIARLLKTSESQIQRIEAGEIDTRSSLLFGFARAVKANFLHLARLLLDDKASDDEVARFSGLAKGMTDDELEAMIVLFDSLRDDPKALARWIGYGERLRDERHGD
jgi:transcriptional regulator with XRE-family HTH domain